MPNDLPRPLSNPCGSGVPEWLVCLLTPDSSVSHFLFGTRMSGRVPCPAVSGWPRSGHRPDHALNKNRYGGHPATLTTEGQVVSLRGCLFSAEEFAEHRVHLHRLFLLDLLVRPEDDTYG